MTIYHRALLKSKLYGGFDGWTRKVNKMSDQQAYAVWLKMRKTYHFDIIVKNLYDELVTTVHGFNPMFTKDDEILDDFVKNYPQFANNKLSVVRIPDVPEVK